MKASGVLLAVGAALLLTWSQASAQDDPDSLYMRVVDVGAGQCCIVRIPGNSIDDAYFVVFDTGNWKGAGPKAIAAVREIIPPDERIDLMILSHTDADHLGGTAKIVDEYFVDRIIRTGMARAGTLTKTLKNTRKAVERAVTEDDCVDINLAEVEFPPGATYRFGDALVTMVCGFGAPLDDWDVRNESERNNAVSIVIRIHFKGKSILLCGDAVGRHNGQAADAAPIATERFMLEQREVIPIRSDVIVAPHHGADNGSSAAFIDEVDPTFVIFSAGHNHEHPRSATAERYIAAGVELGNFFRTDRGDNEGGQEWSHGAGQSADKPGDDDVEVIIDSAGTVTVRYRSMP